MPQVMEKQHCPVVFQLSKGLELLNIMANSTFQIPDHTVLWQISRNHTFLTAQMANL